MDGTAEVGKARKGWMMHCSYILLQYAQVQFSVETKRIEGVDLWYASLPQTDRGEDRELLANSATKNTLKQNVRNVPGKI